MLLSFAALALVSACGLTSGKGDGETHWLGCKSSIDCKRGFECTRRDDAGTESSCTPSPMLQSTGACPAEADTLAASGFPDRPNTVGCLATIWTKNFSGLSPSAGSALSVDRHGNVIVTADADPRVTVDLGGGPIEPIRSISPSTAVLTDVVLAKFTPDGNVLFSRRFPGWDPSIVVDGFDAIWVVFHDAQDPRSHLWKLDPGGRTLWQGSAAGLSVPAVGPSGVVLAGQASRHESFGAGSMVSLDADFTDGSANDGTGAFLAAFDGAGRQRWAAWGSPAPGEPPTPFMDAQKVGDVTQLPDGRAVLLASTVRLLGGPAIATAYSLFETFDPAGKAVDQWWIPPDAGPATGIGRITSDSRGNVIGIPRNTSDFVVTKLDGATYRVLWGRPWLGNLGSADSIATDACDDIVVAGPSVDTVDFGGGPLQPAPTFVAKYGPSGGHLCSRTFSLSGPRPASVATAPTGEVFLVAFVTTDSSSGTGASLMKLAP